MNLHINLAANAMSGRVAVIICIRAPAASRNGASTLFGVSLGKSLKPISVEIITAVQSFIPKRLRMSLMYRREHIVTLPSLFFTRSMSNTNAHLPLLVVSKHPFNQIVLRAISSVELRVIAHRQRIPAIARNILQ